MKTKINQNRFQWKVNKKFNYKLLLSMFAVATLIYGIETFSYFYAAI
jgi:hypothetical protein